MKVSVICTIYQHQIFMFCLMWYLVFLIWITEVILHFFFFLHRQNTELSCIFFLSLTSARGHILWELSTGMQRELKTEQWCLCVPKYHGSEYKCLFPGNKKILEREDFKPIIAMSVSIKISSTWWNCCLEKDVKIISQLSFSNSYMKCLNILYDDLSFWYLN